jgi:carbon-monoxide dehydrogenase medium subunit
MKAPSFHYARPQSRPEALALLARHGSDARVLAGGQSLMPILNMRLAAPSVLVDINGIDDLSGIIAVEERVIRIGALTRHWEVADSPLVREHLPLIAEAMRYVAHAAIRNRGTFGGSLAMADPAAEMPACCLALGGQVVLESVGGRRIVPAGEFFQGIFETALRPDEILVAVDFPIPGPSWRSAFAEFARRHGDFALVGTAVQAQVEGTRFCDLRLVMFGAGDRPLRAYAAERILTAATRAGDALAAAQAALADDLSPLSDNHASAEMRLHLARLLLVRILRRLMPDM